VNIDELERLLKAARQAAREYRDYLAEAKEIPFHDSPSLRRQRDETEGLLHQTLDDNAEAILTRLKALEEWYAAKRAYEEANYQAARYLVAGGKLRGLEERRLDAKGRLQDAEAALIAAMELQVAEAALIAAMESQGD